MNLTPEGKLLLLEQAYVKAILNDRKKLQRHFIMIKMATTASNQEILVKLKDLVKLKHGEYISLGNIESTLKTLPLVETACAYADSSRSKVVVILVPVPEILDELCRDEGVQDGEKSANSYTLGKNY